MSNSDISRKATARGDQAASGSPSAKRVRRERAKHGKATQRQGDEEQAGRGVRPPPTAAPRPGPKGAAKSPAEDAPRQVQPPAPEAASFKVPAYDRTEEGIIGGARAILEGLESVADACFDASTWSRKVCCDTVDAVQQMWLIDPILRAVVRARANGDLEWLHTQSRTAADYLTKLFRNNEISNGITLTQRTDAARYLEEQAHVILKRYAARDCALPRTNHVIAAETARHLLSVLNSDVDYLATMIADLPAFEIDTVLADATTRAKNALMRERSTETESTSKRARLTREQAVVVAVLEAIGYSKTRSLYSFVPKRKSREQKKRRRVGSSGP